MTTSDGTSDGLCCRATWDTVPKTDAASGSSAKAVTSGYTGSVVDTKFYACYKRTGSHLTFTTAIDATTEKSQFAWIAPSDVCGSNGLSKTTVAEKDIHTHVHLSTAQTDKFKGAADLC